MYRAIFEKCGLDFPCNINEPRMYSSMRRHTRYSPRTHPGPGSSQMNTETPDVFKLVQRDPQPAQKHIQGGQPDITLWDKEE
jgi:hypothetical protein